MLYDGQLNWEGGVDSGRSPSLIDTIDCAWAVNTTFRGGYASCRPGMYRIPFANSDLSTLLSTGTFQGSTIYEDSSCNVSLIMSVSGHILKFTLGNTIQGQDISIADDLNQSSLHKVWFQQVENYLVVQDNLDRPLIYDGSTTYRSRASENEVPTGGPMAYGKGRLWVARGRSYVGGDLVGSDGTAASALRFTENTYLNEGGSFYVPSQQGDCSGITAMAFGSNIDTTLGQAELLVFTEGSIFSFDAPVDRTVWKDLRYPLQRFALLDFGAMSQDSVVPVNGDLFFRSRDGIKSFIYARRDFQQSWGNTPIDSEETRAFTNDNERQLWASSGCKFDNRLLMTVGPYRHDRGIVHRGLATLDFNLISQLREKKPPAWEGVWTGVKILAVHSCVYQGEESCFIIGVDSTDSIGIWRLTKSDPFDDGITPIKWILETRMFDYQSKVMSKRLYGMELWWDKQIGSVALTARYRSDGEQCWTLWNTVDQCAQSGSCDEPDDDYCGLRPHNPQGRNRIPFLNPPATNTDNGPSTTGYEHQVRLENTGPFRLKYLRVLAQEIMQPLTGNK